MDGTVRYLLDGRAREVRDADPTMTVLENLRGDLRRMGTKEGCAEGDCGACTVVVGELTEAGGVVWRAVNSCIQFLPMIDGKALVTVESLAREVIHPVQLAMVEHHASQCGFCTPGFVMSLYGRAIGALGSDAPIDEVLAGNLCRCTGYGPIIAAALATTREAAPDVTEALGAIQRDSMLKLNHEDTLHGVSRRWFAPRSLAELGEVATAHPDAIFLAGATDVGLWVTKQHRSLGTIVFLGEVAELKAIEDGPDAVKIGAGATYADALTALAGLSIDLAAMVRRLGSTQVRNAGTIGGNIANGSPIGDMRASAAYRLLAAANLLRKVWAESTLPASATRVLDYADG